MDAKSLRIGLGLTLLLWTAALAAEDKAEDPWESFGLRMTHVEGVTLRYEKKLSRKLRGVRKSLKGFLWQEAQTFAGVNSLMERADEIVDQVNKIAGHSPTAEQEEHQRSILTTFLGKNIWLVQPEHKVTVLLVTQEATKEYLRKGGSLPGFSYDKARDRARYNFEIRWRSGEDEGPRKGAIVIPVSADEPTEGLSTFLRMLSGLQSTGSGIALHEVAEFTLVNYRLKPGDPYFRWFSDGFGNAIAIHMLKSYLGATGPSSAFADSYSISAHADLQRQINLLYWTGEAYAIQAPLKSEKRIKQARYSFATHEAIRLIDAHGIECVAKILDKACKNPDRNDSRNLIPAVKEVTGEDIELRFQRYQTFRTQAEGLRQYTETYKAAAGRKEYEKALPALLRLHELRGKLPFKDDMQFCSTAAYILHQMGHEAAGDHVLLQRAEHFKSRGMNDARVAVHALFIEHARRCGNLAKATPSADVVLEAKPTFVPALAVRMLNAVREGKAGAALKIAARILELEEDPENHWRKMAVKAITVLSEQQRKK